MTKEMSNIKIINSNNFNSYKIVKIEVKEYKYILEDFFFQLQIPKVQIILKSNWIKRKLMLLFRNIKLFYNCDCLIINIPKNYFPLFKKNYEIIISNENEFIDTIKKYILI
jgi:hypothetical protein